MPARLSRCSFCLALSCVAVAAWLQAPNAEASWSQPITVSRPHAVIYGVGFASGPFGDLLTWRSEDVLPAPRTGYSSPTAYEATAPAGQPFGSERRLPGSFATATLVNLGDGKAAQLIVRPSKPAQGPLVTSIAIGDTSGRFAKPERIKTTIAAQDDVSLAGDLRGDLLLTWIRPGRAGEVWASVRRPGGRFGRPYKLATTYHAEKIVASVGPPAHSTAHGALPCDMAVAFETNRRVYVRVRLHGEAWGTLQDIGPTARMAGDNIAVHITRASRVVVAWHHQLLSEGTPETAGFTEVAIEPPGAHRFLPRQTLERDHQATGSNGISVVASGGGRVAVAYLAQPGASGPSGIAPTVVRVAYAKGDRFGASRTISSPAPQMEGLFAAGGSGGAIVTWSATPIIPLSFRGPAIYAATSDRSTGFELGSAQQVSPYESAGQPVAAASIGTNRWVLAWAGRPTQSSSSVVRLATCPAACR